MILTSCLCVGYCVHVAVVPSRPRTWEPSNGAVPTMLRTCGWKEKFCSKVSLLSNCRLDAGREPWSHGCYLGFLDYCQLFLEQLGPLISGRTAQIGLMRPWESTSEKYMVDLLANSSVSMAILCEIWKLSGSFPNLSVFGGNLWYSAPLCILRDEMAPMETPASLWNVRTWSSAFSISGSVIFSNVSSSRSPCAILAVDAIVSTSKGWSIQDTLSVFSSSPKSSRDALAAPWSWLGWSWMPLLEICQLA